ncbi:MAG: hypothetical protein U0793_04685 [Gemmataceae bacterium]
MPRIAGLFLLLLLLPLPAFTGGGKEPTEEVVVQMLGQLEKLADTLSSLKDEDTVAAAREPLKKGVQNFLDLRAKAEKLPPPSREVKDRLAKEYKGKFIAVQEKLMLEISRVRSAVPGGREALKEVSALLGKEAKAKESKEKKDKGD